MKTLISKYTSTSLIVRIIIAIIIGAIIGLFIPQLSFVSIFGSIFVGALKGIAPVLVFTLVMSSIANAAGEIGNKFRTVILLYVLNTLLAAITAVVGSFIFPVTTVLDTAGVDISSAPAGLGQVLSNILTNMVSNPITAIANANYIGILFWAIIFGLALKGPATDHTRVMISDLADMTSRCVRWVIQFAPFGILGLVYDAVSENGLSIFYDYGRLLILLVGCMLVVALIVNPIIAFIFLKKNPYPLVLRCLRESGITAFFTRSSAANIPVNMTLCEKLGLDKDFYSVSVPLGATINMSGAAVTITVMTLAIAHTIGISVDFPSAIVLSVLATLGACGASGVAGGSLLLIPMACSLFGISNDIAMQGVAIGFIIGVIQDSMETAINSSGDVIFAATAEYYTRMKNGEKIDL